MHARHLWRGHLTTTSGRIWKMANIGSSESFQNGWFLGALLASVSGLLKDTYDARVSPSFACTWPN